MLFACILLLNIGFVHAEENVTQNMPLTIQEYYQTSGSAEESPNMPEIRDQVTDDNTTNDNPSAPKIETDNKNEGSNELQAAAGSPTLNNKEIEDAAVRLDNFIKTNNRLPVYVTVAGEQVSPAEFLQLLTAYLTGKNLELKYVGLPVKSTGTNLKGSITKGDYIRLAGRVYNFIELNSRAPNFATFNNQMIKFESLVWLFARIISFKKANQRLPNYVNLENLNNIKSLPLSDNPTNSSANSTTGQIGEGGEDSSGTGGNSSISISGVLSAAKNLKSFIESNKRLPAYVTVSNQNLTVAQFFELMLKVIVQLNSGQTSPLTPRTVTEAPNPSGSATGQITKSEYIQVINKVLDFIKAYGRAPNYATANIGSISYPNMVYATSRILAFYSDNQRLPNYVTINSSANSTTGQIGEGGEDSSGTGGNSSISISGVLSAAKNLKSFIESNKRLPAYVTVSNQNLTVAQFFELMLKVIVQLNSGQTSPLTPRTVTEAPNPSGSATGQITKSEYIQVINKVLDFIKAYGRAPNYATANIGSISYPNMVYATSRILAFYSDNQRLPNYVTITDFSGQNSGLSQYLAATANCQVNDPSIQALAARLTAGLTSAWDKAKAVFNWVRDNISYSFYYNTRYGAVGTLKYRTGNCCDQAHLVVALARAAGLPARYVHGICTFSSGTYGHVWAQIYINGVWYNADPTSTRNSLGVINNWNTATATIRGVYASLPF
ncbi:MAG: pseudomurein-binding repeat-containing protein [Methanothermobacter sp.]|jgi:transglutaminase-like putative cysteine protease/ribosomal protein L39E|nr:pseudomurein-binding repeat-containing protein [Methanothermobacter sp.]